MSQLYFRNRQHLRRVSTNTLRRLTAWVLQDCLGRTDFELGFYLVDAAEIIRLNETFLRHKGSTDVITFDYSEADRPQMLCGEIFICMEEVLKQARRFRTSWQSELVRYLIHGLLHLCGYDDREAAARRRMKQEEDRLLQRADLRFGLAQVGGVDRRRKRPTRVQP